MSEANRATPALARGVKASPGRTSVMAMIGFAAGAVPLPFVPSVVLRRVRGALAHDVAARYGLSLTDEARREIAEPSRTARSGAILATVAFFARRALRRVGVLGLVPPITAWLEIYALGLLFDRYLERVRTSQTVRIHESEAKLVRKAVDAAIARALSPKLELGKRPDAAEPTEELRDFSTRLFDGILLFAAAIPDHLKRRLESAFDAVLAEEPKGT
ncbi:MAG TPA: hypothetical protein VJT73_07070 [Polyangiaceae bacterium]|nr:hypothetical protein [Polyangiaceae bacterium]